MSKIKSTRLSKVTFEATIAWYERQILGRTFRPTKITR